MGWFSKKKKIFVSSVTYNLAGDEKDRVKYLPTTVITKIVADNNFSMSDSIQSALLNGPGIRMRSFARWSRLQGYTNTIGMQAGRLLGATRVDIEQLTGQIPHGSDETISIDTTEVGGAEYSHWAEQWMSENHPTELDADYELDYLEAENTVFITFTDGHSYSFQPIGFNINAQYLYAGYLLESKPVPEAPVLGPLVPVDSSSDYPPTTGWDLEDNTSTSVQVALLKTVTVLSTFSDGRPSTTTTTNTPTEETFVKQKAVFSQTVYEGNSAGAVDEIVSTKTYQTNMHDPKVVQATNVVTTTETMPDGVIKTVKTTTVTQSVGDVYTYQVDTQRVVDKRWSARKTFIYQYDTGNAVLDSMFGNQSNNGDYYPFIPVRQESRMLDDNYYGGVYRQNLIAYKKAFGRKAKYGDLIKSLAANSSIRDVDYGYVVFGVSLNTREHASLKYVYKFFQTLMQQGHGGGGYDTWKAAWNLANIRMEAWVDWKNAQSDPASPLFGKPEPVKGVYPQAPTNRLKVYSGIFSFNMVISWNYMAEVTGTGLGRPGAKQGDIWWTQGNDDAFNEIVYSGGVVGIAPASSGAATLTWQDSPNTYRSISTRGLHHNYTIYKGKGVGTSIKECLNDAEVSGFVLPLNEAAFRAMSLVDATQMSQANAYIVLNSYKVVKQKWYQTGWFKIILVVIVIVITVLSAGAGGASAGLLGAAATVGTALGFSGMAAIIVGSLANALAAMILTQIIMRGAVALFGDKVGTIVGVIASVIAVSAGSSMASGQGMAATYSNMASAESIMRLSVAAGNGLAEYMGAETRNIIEDTRKLMEEYEEKTMEILNTYDKILGLGTISLDPMALTEIGRYEYIPESLDVFLGRTLLVGSDIAGMTNDMLTNFTKMTLNQELS